MRLPTLIMALVGAVIGLTAPAGVSGAMAFDDLGLRKAPASMGLFVKADAGLDAKGNGNRPASAEILDAMGPVATITVQESFSGTTAIPVNITFDEPVTSFDQAMIEVTNASIASFSGSGAIYVASILPVGIGTIVLTIPEGVTRDAADNLNVLVAEDVIDVGRPDVVVAFEDPDAGGFSADRTVVLMVSFTREVWGTDAPVANAGFGDAADVAVSGGSWRMLDGGGHGAEFRIAVIADAYEDVSVQVVESAAAEYSGDGLAAAALNWSRVSNALSIAPNRDTAITSQLIADFIVERGTQLVANRPDFAAMVRGGGASAPAAWIDVNGSDLELALDTGLRRRGLGAGMYGWARVAGSLSNFGDDDLAFAILQAGIDREILDGFWIGAIGEMDYAAQEDKEQGSKVSGIGFLVGPYFVWDTAPLDGTLEGQLSWGRSFNKIDPYGFYEDEFDTTRWLAHVKFSTDYQQGAWSFSPFGALDYLQERQDEYVDSRSAQIPAQTIKLGEASFGSDLSYGAVIANGLNLSSGLGVSGIYTFTLSEQHLSEDFALEKSDLRGRVDLSVGVSGEEFGVEAQIYRDGLGTDGMESWGAGLQFELRF